MENNNSLYTRQKGADFLNVRLPKLKETDPSEFEAIKTMMLVAIEEAIAKREKNGLAALTKAEIMGNLQYCPRAIEKTDGRPFVMGTKDALREGSFEEELFVKLEKVVCSFFTNLTEEIDRFTEEHGDEIKEILEKKGNLVFVCTHPSWYGLLIPSFLMGKIDKSVLKDSLISMITAIGPLMVEKEILGMKVNPQDILVALGTNVLKTVPHKEEYEKNEDVLNFGNTMRYKFGREFALERGRMKREGGRSLIIAPEGTTTLVSEKDGTYEIYPIDAETDHLLQSCGEMSNTHFVILGISEEKRKRRNDLVPTNVTLKAKTISPKELQERIAGGEFIEGLRQDMADMVNGRIQKKKSPQHFNDIA